jgi:hydroxymethylbilane synthase
VTARLAAHLDVAACAPQVLELLVSAGVDVDAVGVEDMSSDGATRDLLTALRESSIDLALVGINALRGSAADGLTTVAVLPREEVRDVLVTVAGDPTPLMSLSAGVRVGVVGDRRRAFLAAHRPDVTGVTLTREEMDTVLAGSMEDCPDALVISAIDARMAGLVESTVEALEPKSWLPAPGQGAVALVARHPIAEATALDHLPTRTAIRTELALLDALEVRADAPLGCLAQPSGRWIRLWAAAASADGTRLVRSDLTGPLDEPEGLGLQVARELNSRGYGLVVAPVSS